MKARKETILKNKRCQCEDWQAVDEKRRMGGRRKTNTEASKKIIKKTNPCQCKCKQAVDDKRRMGAKRKTHIETKKETSEQIVVPMRRQATHA